MSHVTYMHAICIHTYIHTYMHACIHTCIHTYIHTYIQELFYLFTLLFYLHRQILVPKLAGKMGVALGAGPEDLMGQSVVVGSGEKCMCAAAPLLADSSYHLYRCMGSILPYHSVLVSCAGAAEAVRPVRDQ